jgi:HSP20 family protein
MNLVKRNPRNFFMDEFFKDWTGGTQMANRTVPAVNIKETDAAYSVALVAPGLNKEDFAIEVDNGVLTISHTAATDKAGHEEGKYTRREFVIASFKRSFTLPETVNEEEIKAAYENGILTLTLPKKEEAQPKAKRLVAIS